MNSAAVDAAFAALSASHERLSSRTLASLFDQPDRFAQFSILDDGLVLDFSKCAVDQDALAQLLTLAEAAEIASQRDTMLSGAIFNNTEKRAVLHTALRGGATVSDATIRHDVESTRRAFCSFAEAVRDGRIAAADGQPFTDVVNIGIG